MKKRFLIIIFLFILSVINVKAIDYLGDVNGDGKVSVNDYVLVRKHLLRLYSITGDEFTRADVNSDGKISAADYIEIRKIILYKTDLVPVSISTPEPTTTIEPTITPIESKIASIPTNNLCVSRIYNGKSQQLTSVIEGVGYTLSDYNGTNVGKYTITAKLSTGYKWKDNTTKNKKFECSIDKAANVVTITSKSYTYNGKGKSTTVVSTFGSPTITYYSDSSCKTKTTTSNATAIGGTPKVTGTYYAKATVTGTSNYSDGKSGCKEAVIINKTTNVVTITAVTKTYTGDGIGTNATATNGTPSITYYSDSNCETKTTTTNATAVGGTPKIVGTYYAKATVSASTNYKAASSGCQKAVIINKANNPITVTVSQEWSPSPSSKDQTTTIIAAKNAKGKVTYEIQSQPGGNYFTLSGTTLTMKANTKDGTYKLVIRATAAGNSLYKSGYKDIAMVVIVSSVLPQITKKVQSGFKVTQEYDSSTFKYWIEHSTNAYRTHGSSSLYLTHIWVKDPAKQIRIALGGGTTLGNKEPIALMTSEINRLSLSSKGIIAVNSSFFGDSGISSWGSLQSTRVLIYNGKFLRDDCSKDFGSGKAIYSSYGITKDGQIKFYNTAPASKCESEKQKMINDGVIYSSGAHALIKKDNDNHDPGYSRTMICTMNKNNFIIITAYNLQFYKAANLAYNILGCQSLINVDGGGSTTLLYKKNNTSIAGAGYKTSRKLADMLYFVEK